MIVVRGSYHRFSVLVQSMMRRAPYLTKGIIFLGLLGALLCVPIIGEVAEIAAREAMGHGPATRLWSMAGLPVGRFSLVLLAGALTSVTIAAFLRARARATWAAPPREGVLCLLRLESFLPPPRGSVEDSDDSSSSHNMRSQCRALKTPRLRKHFRRPGGLSLAGRSPPVRAVASDRPP